MHKQYVGSKKQIPQWFMSTPHTAQNLDKFIPWLSFLAIFSTGPMHKRDDPSQASLGTLQSKSDLIIRILKDLLVLRRAVKCIGQLITVQRVVGAIDPALK